ncbi:MAG: S26 family signal peptidase [Spirochaetota bacterium]
MSKRSRALRYYRSYKPQGPIKKGIRFVVKLIVLVFLLHLLITTFFFRSFHIKNVSQLGEQPVYAGRLLTTPLPYGPRVDIVDYRLPAVQSPKRGDLVVVETGNPPELPWYALILNSLSRFFTFHSFVPFEENEFSNASRYQVMRIIGMPGDEIRMSAYRIEIKTPTASHFIDEQEVIQTDYTLVIPPLPNAEDSSDSNSLAGAHPALQLSGREYLLAPDDRHRFALSKYWQPTSPYDIVSKALLVYWPQFAFL